MRKECPIFHSAHATDALVAGVVLKTLKSAYCDEPTILDVIRYKGPLLQRRSLPERCTLIRQASYIPCSALCSG
jgi:hypothetical protein